MAQEVAADQLGDEFKGYVVRITGGNDVRVACSLTLGVCIAQVTDAIYSQLLSLSHPSRLDSTALLSRLDTTGRPTTVNGRTGSGWMHGNWMLLCADNSWWKNYGATGWGVWRVQKQGFPLKQGVLVPHRVRLLLAKGHSCYRPRRTGERKRKSVRGCIVGPDVRALHLVVVKQGENDIPGLTDEVLPKRLGPKRATKIRRFFNLDKSDDVRKFVIRREVVPKKEGAKPYTKAPKIQRLYVHAAPLAFFLALSSSSRLTWIRYPASHARAQRHSAASPAPPSPPLARPPQDRGAEGPEGRVRADRRQAPR